MGPVWPLELNENWNLITRTIVPVVSQPAIFPGQDRETGLGDITFTAFFIKHHNNVHHYGKPGLNN